MTSSTVALPPEERNFTVPPVDLARIAVSPRVVPILRELAIRVRGEALELAPDGHVTFTVTPLLQLMSGKPLERAVVTELVDAASLDVLLRCGAMVAIDEYVLASIGFGWAGPVPVVVPFHQLDDAERVYIGSETPWLTKLAFRHGPGGGRAAELAAGTGAVAAAMSALYHDVVAADLLPQAVACAELTLSLNAIPGRSARAVVADVAAGLEPESFDLVVGNPPWVPTQRSTGNPISPTAAGEEWSCPRGSSNRRWDFLPPAVSGS